MDMMTNYGFSTTDFNGFYDGSNACGSQGFNGFYDSSCGSERYDNAGDQVGFNVFLDDASTRSSQGFNGFYEDKNTCGVRGFDAFSSRDNRSLSSFNEASSRFSDFDFGGDHVGFSHRASSDYQYDFQMGFSSYGGEAFSFLEKFS